MSYTYALRKIARPYKRQMSEKNLPVAIIKMTFAAVLILSALGFSSPGNSTAPEMPAGDGAIGSRTPVNLDPFENPVTPAPNVAPDLLPLLGVNIHFIRDNADLDAAKSAGFTWVRMDLDWSRVERVPGKYNFSAYDGLLAAIEARHLRVLFIFDYGNPRYTGGWDTPPTTPAAIEAFGNFAEAAARHFAGHGVRFEIWNEPNISRFWPPQPDPTQYAALARSVISRVHAGDPQAEVATAGLSSTDFPFLRQYLADGGGAGANAIGIHPYGFELPEEIAGDMAAWRSMVAQALPANPPTWATEWGYSSAEYGNGHSPEARAEQAVMVARELLTAWSEGFPLIIYYDIRDDGSNPNDPEQNFGLLAEDYSDKPAMQAVRTLTAIVRGRQMVGFLPLESPNLHSLELNGASDSVVILWADTGQANVALPPGSTALNLYGAPLTLHPTGAQLSLTVDDRAGPVYLFFPK